MKRCHAFIAAVAAGLLAAAGTRVAHAEQWNHKADMTAPRLFFSAAAADGQVYAVGGMLAQVLPSTHAYDPTADEWSERADMPTARAGMSSAVVDSKLYVIGGWTDTEPAISTVEE